MTAGFTDCGTLIAFSGSLKDEKSGHEFTEAKLNAFSEGELPKMFGYVRADDPLAAAAATKPEYRLLVVAEKYQTGFDQPLLCAMYVDKPLTGVAAVQTLSRLNRILPPLKAQDDVRVLDFVNTAEDIQDVVRAVVRDHGHRPDRPEPAVRQAAAGHGVRGAVGCRRWRRSSGCSPRPGPGG